MPARTVIEVSGNRRILREYDDEGALVRVRIEPLTSGPTADLPPVTRTPPPARAPKPARRAQVPASAPDEPAPAAVEAPREEPRVVEVSKPPKSAEEPPAPEPAAAVAPAHREDTEYRFRKEPENAVVRALDLAARPAEDALPVTLEPYEEPEPTPAPIELPAETPHANPYLLAESDTAPEPALLRESDSDVVVDEDLVAAEPPATLVEEEPRFEILAVERVAPAPDVVPPEAEPEPTPVSEPEAEPAREAPSPLVALDAPSELITSPTSEDAEEERHVIEESTPSLEEMAPADEVAPAPLPPPRYADAVPDLDSRVDALLRDRDRRVKAKKRAPLPVPTFEPLRREPWEERLDAILREEAGA